MKSKLKQWLYTNGKVINKCLDIIIAVQMFCISGAMFGAWMFLGSLMVADRADPLVYVYTIIVGSAGLAFCVTDVPDYFLDIFRRPAAKYTQNPDRVTATLTEKGDQALKEAEAQ